MYLGNLSICRSYVTNVNWSAVPQQSICTPSTYHTVADLHEAFNCLWVAWVTISYVTPQAPVVDHQIAFAITANHLPTPLGQRVNGVNTCTWIVRTKCALVMGYCAVCMDESRWPVHMSEARRLISSIWYSENCSHPLDWKYLTLNCIFWQQHKTLINLELSIYLGIQKHCSHGNN